MKLKKILLGIFLSFSMAFGLSISDLNEIRGDNPTPYDLNSYILKKCKDHNIPPIIMKAILLQEGAPNNKWKQFYDNGVIVSGDDGDGNSYGLGLFQITRKLNTANESEVRKFVKYWKNNVDKAVGVLIDRWGRNLGGMSGVDTDPLIIENWYYPIAWYNGEGTPARNYVKKIYGFMQNKSKVESMLYGSDNYNTILNYYKTVSNISLPDIIPSFSGGAISAHSPEVYTLRQIVDNGGEIHRWNKSSNTYEVYNINHSSTIVTTNMKPNLNNEGYKKSLNPFSLEQCTAFVWGRAYEKLGIKINFSVTSGRHAKNWLKYVTGLKQGTTLKSNSIVVWGGDFHKKSNGKYKNAYGHVAFIEKIENGYVYFNEANFLTFSSGGYYDGKIKIWSIEKFEKYRSYAGEISGYIYLDSEEIVPTNSSIFDGAGSLVSPNEDGAGANYDYAIMHPHSPYNSTVVFQWLYDINSCSKIDLFSYPNNLDVTIRAKAWNNHKIKNAFDVTLNKYNKNDLSNGVTLKRVDVNNEWTTLAVTSKKPLNGTTHIIARCRDNLEAFKYGNRVDITPKLVDVSHNYYWTGTGSVISTLENRDFEDAGVGRDVAVTYNANNSFTSFQWLSSDNCSKLKIKSYNGSTDTIKEIKIKKWNVKEWKSTSCSSSLPCTISAPSIGDYYIVKIKSSAGAIKSGGLIAECVQ